MDPTDLVTSAVDSLAISGTGDRRIRPPDRCHCWQYADVNPTAILDGTETSDTLTWDFNSGSETFDYLATGETLILTYTVTATDDDGTPRAIPRRSRSRSPVPTRPVISDGPDRRKSGETKRH